MGLSLLERVILSCGEAGVSDFYLVTGSRADEVEAHAAELGRRLQVSVKPVFNQNWREGNGTSVSVVAPYIESRFFLLMADHLFDPEVLESLLAAGAENDCCLLAVDRRTDRVFDLNGATKVRVYGDAVVAIGKNLETFDAIDTGVFLCSRRIFGAVDKAGRDGGGSLSDGVDRLIAEGGIAAVDIGDRLWADVDTPESLSAAKRLLLSEQPKPEEDGYISTYVNRPVSARITRFLTGTPISPNFVSVVSFLVCLAGAFLFGLGEYLWTVIAGVLVQIASVLDGCDGEIARLKFKGSPFGAWLDTIMDRYADVAIAAGITYGYWLAHPHPAVWLIGIAAMSGFVLASYTAKEYALRHTHKLPGGLLGKLAKRDLRLFAFFVGALFNRPFEALALIGFISHLSVVWSFVTAYLRKKQKTPNR